MGSFKLLEGHKHSYHTSKALLELPMKLQVVLT